MIEKIITSKTRAKLLELFLTHIDDRYYLRELERMLDESLSPLRRQLLKLVKMGILLTEEEANLKYYRLNKNFEGIEELSRLVLGHEKIVAGLALPKAQDSKAGFVATAEHDENDKASSTATRQDNKRIKYDIAVLTLVSIFVLVTSIFVLYTSTSNIKQLAGLVSDRTTEVVSRDIAQPTRPDEMVSKRWKVIPGNVPALSTGEMEGAKKSKEL